MPTLFISYKRGTAAVAPLMERLRDAHYRLWFDRDEIHLGDANWKARIDQGIQQCDGLILNLTPAACVSEAVQYEVKKAQVLGKPIFPIVLEKIENWSTALTQVGLTPDQHTEDFTDVTKWSEQVQRLISDLELQGLRVTRHDRRQQRDRNNHSYVLHQAYLKRLADRIGTLNLAQINPDNLHGVELERVYIDSPTELGIGIKLQGDEEYESLTWWISRYEKPNYYYSFPSYEETYSPEDLGLEYDSLKYLVFELEEENKEIYRLRYRDSPSKYEGEEAAIRLHLKHLAAACDHLVILGAPGSGKSTFVKFLALCLAGSGIDGWTRQASTAALDNWPHGMLTPVYIELRRLVVSRYFPTDVSTPATADHLWAYIQYEVLGEALAAYADHLRYDLEHGHAVLILDGLDEVPYPEGKLKQRQQQLISLAQSVNTRYATSRIIVASRPYAYEGWALPDFQAVSITEFEDKHRIALASRLYQTAGLDEDDAKAKAQSLNHQLQQIDDELKDRPLFVTLMATIHLRDDSEGLPTRRGALYRESILLLLDRWTQSKPGAPSLAEILGEKSAEDLYARLAALAYAVHEQLGEQPGAPEISYELLFKHLKPLGKKTAIDLISYLSENAGVLVCPGQDSERDVFHFAHRTFQEYLAAAHLMTLCAEADSFGLVRELIMSKPQVWRVPCMLAGDVLADTDRRGDLWDLLDDLLDDVEDIPADDPRWWTVWLAGAILQEQKLLESEKLRHGERAVADQLRKWLVLLVKTPQALPPVERVLCGRALSLLGDPRPGVGTMIVRLGDETVELPDLAPQSADAWCDVPVPDDGTVLLDAYDQKDNRRPVEIGNLFKISRYLVTNRQFQAFIDSGEYNGDWWNDMPEEFQRQPIQDAYNRIANHPRDSVSWYQAVAFTRWLTAKFRDAGLMDDSTEIRLPTQIEWEIAARGTDKRVYPYPDDFDPAKGNTRETGIGQTSAVGLFPDGASLCGAFDMCGNLWEWCLNKYKTPQENGADASGDYRVLRGGSFLSKHSSAAVLDRDDFNPYRTDIYFGFRIVCAPPLTSVASCTLHFESE